MAEQMPPVAPSPSIGTQLRLGRNWRPGAASWDFRGHITTPAGEAVAVLVLEGSSGDLGVAITATALRALAEQCVAKADELDAMPIIASSPLVMPHLKGLPGNGRR